MSLKKLPNSCRNERTHDVCSIGTASDCDRTICEGIIFIQVCLVLSASQTQTCVASHMMFIRVD